MTILPGAFVDKYQDYLRGRFPWIGDRELREFSAALHRRLLDPTNYFPDEFRFGGKYGAGFKLFYPLDPHRCYFTQYIEDETELSKEDLQWETTALRDELRVWLA